MSEVYNFKSMSQVDVLEEPADGTTLLAVENGAVKQIPVAKLGGGGTGGGYMVNAELNAETMEIISVDKTRAEILAAVESGCAPVLRLNLPAGEEASFYLLPMMASMEGELMFAVAMTLDAMMIVACMPENEWVLSMENRGE